MRADTTGKADTRGVQLVASCIITAGCQCILHAGPLKSTDFSVCLISKSHWVISQRLKSDVKRNVGSADSECCTGVAGTFLEHLHCVSALLDFMWWW